VNAMMANGG